MQGVLVNGPIFAVFFGRSEMAVVLVFVLLLFGFKRFPGPIRELRRGIREFRKGVGIGLAGFDQQAGEAGQSLGGIHGKLAAESLTTDNQTVELYDPPVLRDGEKAAGGAKRATRKLRRLIGRFLSVLCAPFTALLGWGHRVARACLHRHF
jgi:Sec-independent protein translocase protein TatA